MRANFMLVAFAYLCGAHALGQSAEGFDAGVFTIASRRGSVLAEEQDSGQFVPVQRDAVFRSTPVSFNVAKETFVAIVFSNGSVLHASNGARFTIEHFTQQPFDPTVADPLREPSRTRLRLNLYAGTYALLSREVNPLSKLEIHTPQVQLENESSFVFLEVSSEGTDVLILSGHDVGLDETSAPQTIRFRLGDEEPEDYQQPGQYLRVSAGGSRYTLESPSLPRKAEAIHFLQQADRAGEPIRFIRKGEDLQPVRVVDPGMRDIRPTDNYRITR